MERSQGGRATLSFSLWGTRWLFVACMTAATTTACASNPRVVSTLRTVPATVKIPHGASVYVIEAEQMDVRDLAERVARVLASAGYSATAVSLEGVPRRQFRSGDLLLRMEVAFAEYSRIAAARRITPCNVLGCDPYRNRQLNTVSVQSMDVKLLLSRVGTRETLTAFEFSIEESGREFYIGRTFLVERALESIERALLGYDETIVVTFRHCELLGADGAIWLAKGGRWDDAERALKRIVTRSTDGPARSCAFHNLALIQQYAPAPSGQANHDVLTPKATPAETP